MLKKLTFIVNGKLKHKHKIYQQINELFGNEYVIDFLFSEYHGHAIELSQKATEKETDYLIAIGGDGTTNEVINGYLIANKSHNKKVILGLLPSGTGNDFARSLKITKSIEDLHLLIKQEKYSLIDVGEVEYTDLNGQIKYRYFNNISQIGVGAQTVKYVNGSSKYLGATLTFILATIKAFLGYKHQDIILKTDNFDYQGKVVSVCFANGKYMGGGLGVAPHADVTNGKLNIVIVGKVTVFEFIKYLPTLRKLKYISHKEVHYKSATKCQLIAKNEQRYPVEMDGEYIGVTPINVNIHPQKINFLM